MSRLISSCSFNITRARTPIEVFFQVLKASAAPVMAASSSSLVANGTRASTSWVAGLMTSFQIVVLDSTNLPLIRSLTVGAALVTAADWDLSTADMAFLLG